MKLGIAIDWAGADIAIPLDKVRAAERLGFDSVWCAEAYGSDALTPLAFIAAHTTRLKLCTSIAQVAARPPAACAMQVNTLDALAGRGRVMLGLGLSGPQIVEGWYGQPWQSPVETLRDYVAILRKVWRREGPVVHDGQVFQLPTRAPGSQGMGKPLKSILHTNPDIPILLGTGSQATVTLTAEIADGWIPFGFVPGSLEHYRPWLEEGFRRAGGGKSLANFHIQCGCSVDTDSNVRAALDRLKPMVALYVGGMGHKDRNFHKQAMIRRGYPEAAQRIQELFLAGRRDEAIAAVPDEYVDEGALLGDAQRIKKRVQAWQASGASGLTLYGADIAGMEMIAGMFR